MTEENRASSFDELTRGLASGSISRGRALRLMGAALVGGTLASLGIGEAGADECKRNGKRCKKNSQCCSRNCESGTCAAAPPTCGSTGATCTGNTDCCSELVCKGPPGQRTCAESCIPPNAISCDPNNPGSCPGGGVGGCFCNREASGGGFCFSNGSGIPCTTSCDCPAGQFCTPSSPTGLCAIAAEMCPRF